jgi:type II secretory ATPase GspE/PulE/Tfp pilus assembly ATPase PilB-like protein
MPAVGTTPEDALAGMAGASAGEALQLLLGAAIGAGATHVHIHRRAGKAEVRLRTQGKLRPPHAVPLHTAEAILNKLRNRANVGAPVRRYPLEGVFRIRIGDRRYRFSLSSLGGVEGDHIVIGIEPGSRDDPASLDRIGMRPDTLDAYRKAIGRERGLLLYVAPPLMGKTTTIYATLNALKGADRLVMTYETPIKARLEGVEQVDPSFIPGLDPIDGYRALLNQNADILMLGDLSPPEAMRTAVHAALNGTLVLGRVHGRSALEFLPRMTSQGISAVHLASALAGVVGQRLADRLCPHCVKPQVPSPPLRDEMERALGRKVSLIHRASGCPECGGTGKAGHVGIFEFFPGGKTLQRLLLQKVPTDRIETEARENGLELLVKDGMEKVLEGVTSYESLHAAL